MHPSEPPTPAEQRAADELISDELDRLIDLHRQLHLTGDPIAVRGSLVAYLTTQEYDLPATAALLALAIERLA
ncbi:hypothetical protein [Amycolatopsis magusensis]|uniref:hypothetical protein n=1 Tax=Amycolatopsis magusensis TaxID=882444 RepID=UPI0037B61E4B